VGGCFFRDKVPVNAVIVQVEFSRLILLAPTCGENLRGEFCSYFRDGCEYFFQRRHLACGLQTFHLCLELRRSDLWFAHQLMTTFGVSDSSALGWMSHKISWLRICIRPPIDVLNPPSSSESPNRRNKVWTSVPNLIRGSS